MKQAMDSSVLMLWDCGRCLRIAMWTPFIDRSSGAFGIVLWMLDGAHLEGVEEMRFLIGIAAGTESTPDASRLQTVRLPGDLPAFILPEKGVSLQ